MSTEKNAACQCFAHPLSLISTHNNTIHDIKKESRPDKALHIEYIPQTHFRPLTVCP